MDAQGVGGGLLGGAGVEVGGQGGQERLAAAKVVGQQRAQPLGHEGGHRARVAAVGQQ